MIMLSGEQSLDTVVKAIKLGAFHYVAKTGGPSPVAESHRTRPWLRSAAG